MKNIISNLATIGLFSGILLIACDSSAKKVALAKDKVQIDDENFVAAKEDLKQSLEDSLTLVQRDSLTSWQKFKKESEEKISDNEKRITELKAGIAGKSKDIKAGYKKSINDLNLKNDSLKTRISDYKDDKKESLENFKEKINSDINDISESLKRIKVK